MKHLNLSPALYHYLLDVSLDEHPVLQALREDIANHPLAGMQIAPEQAQFMQFLIRLIQAKKILELGTFAGYSALAMALALPEDGRLITCDINTQWTAKTDFFWQQAQQAHKIELRLAPALQTMTELVKTHHQQSFDFIFIDADKTNYLNYYELALQLVTPQGMIAIDNVLWEGTVIDELDKSAQTREIRKLNAFIKRDQRIHKSLLPIADGLLLIQLKHPISN
ncbi:MAG: class I SAM-dependent methyltransferase [Legionella sp.]